MRGITRALVCMVFLSVWTLAPALAQDAKYEFSLGVHYPLVSEGFEIEQDPAYNARFSVAVNDVFSIGVLYELLESTDNFDLAQLPVPKRGDVEMTTYGIFGEWVVAGDPGFEVLVVGALGQGEVEYENPNVSAPGLPDDSDISLWVEAGGGVRFGAGERWAFRIQVTGRRIKPERESLILTESETFIVPTFTVGIRF
ncbi:MAG: hypothetical protein JSV80_05505 [Acidobacteriota bacterium]|nr:MAG: hypothetical protein JSV80_05505 [Acidobacteriota bacterium]